MLASGYGALTYGRTKEQTDMTVLFPNSTASLCIRAWV